jgi:hypothetical protein
VDSQEFRASAMSHLQIFTIALGNVTPLSAVILGERDARGIASFRREIATRQSLLHKQEQAIAS